MMTSTSLTRTGVPDLLRPRYSTNGPKNRNRSHTHRSKSTSTTTHTHTSTLTSSLQLPTLLTSRMMMVMDPQAQQQLALTLLELRMQVYDSYRLVYTLLQEPLSSLGTFDQRNSSLDRAHHQWNILVQEVEHAKQHQQYYQYQQHLNAAASGGGDSLLDSIVLVQQKTQELRLQRQEQDTSYQHIMRRHLLYLSELKQQVKNLFHHTLLLVPPPTTTTTNNTTTNKNKNWTKSSDENNPCKTINPSSPTSVLHGTDGKDGSILSSSSSSSSSSSQQQQQQQQQQDDSIQDVCWMEQAWQSAVQQAMRKELLQLHANNTTTGSHDGEVPTKQNPHLQSLQIQIQQGKESIQQLQQQIQIQKTKVQELQQQQPSSSSSSLSSSSSSLFHELQDALIQREEIKMEMEIDKEEKETTSTDHPTSSIPTNEQQLTQFLKQVIALSSSSSSSTKEKDDHHWWNQSLKDDFIQMIMDSYQRRYDSLKEIIRLDTLLDELAMVAVYMEDVQTDILMWDEQIQQQQQINQQQQYNDTSTNHIQSIMTILHKMIYEQTNFMQHKFLTSVSTVHQSQQPQQPQSPNEGNTRIKRTNRLYHGHEKEEDNDKEHEDMTFLVDNDMFDHDMVLERFEQTLADRDRRLKETVTQIQQSDQRIAELEELLNQKKKNLNHHHHHPKHDEREEEEDESSSVTTQETVGMSWESPEHSPEPAIYTVHHGK